MKHHNFLIGSNEVPEEKIQQELEKLRQQYPTFQLLSTNVKPNMLNTALVTVEFKI